MSKIQEQIAIMKVKKNPGKPGNFWLGCISFSRTRDVLDLLSLGSNIQKILSRIQA